MNFLFTQINLYEKHKMHFLSTNDDDDRETLVRKKPQIVKYLFPTHTHLHIEMFCLLLLHFSP